MCFVSVSPICATVGSPAQCAVCVTGIAEETPSSCGALYHKKYVQSGKTTFLYKPEFMLYKEFMLYLNLISPFDQCIALDDNCKIATQ